LQVGDVAVEVPGLTPSSFAMAVTLFSWKDAGWAKYGYWCQVAGLGGHAKALGAPTRFGVRLSISFSGGR
jgi:hypothetical protein